MKISTKRKLTLGFLGFIFIFSCILFDNNIGSTQVKTSESWSNFTHIYILNNNWTDAESLGWVSGSGSAGDPFILENMTINAGGSGSGIIIENSSLNYFRINNF